MRHHAFVCCWTSQSEYDRVCSVNGHWSSMCPSWTSAYQTGGSGIFRCLRCGTEHVLSVHMMLAWRTVCSTTIVCCFASIKSSTLNVAKKHTHTEHKSADGANTLHTKARKHKKWPTTMVQRKLKVHPKRNWIYRHSSSSSSSEITRLGNKSIRANPTQKCRHSNARKATPMLPQKRCRNG